MPITEQRPVFVSAAICTRNRPDMIGQAVASVLANNYPAFDLTVIDQSTTDDTERALQRIMEANQRLHYVRLNESGASRARNAAIRRSSGEILAFTDDDCVVPRDWLAAIVRAFTADEEADLLYGTVLPPPDDSEGVTPSIEVRRPERLSRRDGFKVFGMGANFAARRRLFARAGIFDELLGPGAPLHCSEDFDLSYRAYRAGAAILLRPEVQVVHYGTRHGGEWAERVRDYGIGNGAFFWKHVRCGDAFALWLLTTSLFEGLARGLAKRVLRRATVDLIYMQAVLVGIRASSRFTVDRRSRLYVPRCYTPRTDQA